LKRIEWMEEFLMQFQNAEDLLVEVVGALSSYEARDVFDYILRNEGSNAALDIEIGRRDKYEILDDILDNVFVNNAELLLENVVRAISEQEAKEVFEYIARMHDLRVSGIRESYHKGGKKDMNLSIYECPECNSEFKAPESLSERIYTCPYCMEDILIEASNDRRLVEQLGSKVDELVSIEYTSDYYNIIYEIADELGVPVYYRDMQHIPGPAIRSLIDDMNAVDTSNPEAVKDVLKDYNLIPKNA